MVLLTSREIPSSSQEYLNWADLFPSHTFVRSIENVGTVQPEQGSIQSRKNKMVGSEYVLFVFHTTQFKNK